jgi:hypothetical protein
MVQAIFDIVSNSFFSTLAVVGASTIIYKIGNFLKTLEDEPEDSYRKAFDKTMVNSMEEINFCFDSVKRIAGTTSKATSIISEIALGSKIVQKDKSGKIIITDKSKLQSQYENTISELHSKLEKYKHKLERKKKQKQTSSQTHSSSQKKYDDSSLSSDNENSDSDTQSLEEMDIKKNIRNRFSKQMMKTQKGQILEEESDEEFVMDTK